MNIHEYQAKSLLSKYGVTIPKGGVAYTVEEALKVAQGLQPGVWVVKAQIHAGGRGKGGGVKLVKTFEDLSKEATNMLGMTLITPQTGPQGKEVKRIYIEEGSQIDRELYLSLLIDRATSQVTIVASRAGGMDIEEVAATKPQEIVRVAIDSGSGFSPFYGRKVAFALGLAGGQINHCVALLSALYKAFIELDASLIEINPLVVTRAGGLIALDAKLGFDDNALFRHEDIEALRDEEEENPAEREATRQGLNYVKLKGNVGCMVNGAGLAMATMDIIKLYGGEPANFLDVGGGATRERVTLAFKLILSDPDVEGILVNIFGGIMRCDIIADGIVAAARDMSLTVPLVVRLEGTNVDLGKKILSQSGLSILAADDLAEAAQKIVQAVQEAA